MNCQTAESELLPIAGKSANSFAKLPGIYIADKVADLYHENAAIT
jgi:hypothetical protein